MGYVDKTYSVVDGVAAFLKNDFSIMVSNFNKKKPTGPTLTYLKYGLKCGQVKISLYIDQGKQVLGTFDGVPKAVKQMPLPNSKSEYGYDRDNVLFTGYTVNGLPIPGMYAHLTYTTNGW